MTTRHATGLAVFTLATLIALATSGSAQIVESAPTNCCIEIYWTGWELGQLRSIADDPSVASRRRAGLHMDRLSTTLEAANETCCRFCEAWETWPGIQDEIRTTAAELLAAPRGETPAARRAFSEWVEGQPGKLIEGLNRCDLEDGMPCKWLQLVECARRYFSLGVELGHAMGAAAAARDDAGAAPEAAAAVRAGALASLRRASGLMGSLHAGGDAARSSPEPVRCNYLWQAEPGAARLFADLLSEPDSFDDARLVARATEVHRLVLRLLLDGLPDLEIPACPIGATHDHADCERAEEHGFARPAEADPEG